MEVEVEVEVEVEEGMAMVGKILEVEIMMGGVVRRAIGLIPGRAVVGMTRVAKVGGTTEVAKAGGMTRVAKVGGETLVRKVEEEIQVVREDGEVPAGPGTGVAEGEAQVVLGLGILLLKKMRRRKRVIVMTKDGTMKRRITMTMVGELNNPLTNRARAIKSEHHSLTHNHLKDIIKLLRVNLRRLANTVSLKVRNPMHPRHGGRINSRHLYLMTPLPHIP